MSYMKAMPQLSHRHPAFWVRHVLSNQVNNGIVSNNIMLTFSKYRYLPQSFKDERYSFNMPYWYTSDDIILNAINGLGDGEELAFHSQVFDFGQEYHLPLIDFGNVDRGIIDSSTLRELSDYWKLSFKLYNSGRSYHAYGDRLISYNDWISFMGSLLLLNKSSGFKLIDERWVGHRIMARYSALRWSCNTSQYKRIPEYVGYLNSNGLFSDTAPNF